MINLQNKYNSKLSFPEFTLKIERGVKQQCQLCKSSYGVFKKQHVCKRCLRSVCAQCSPFKVKNYLANRTIKLNRHCTICNIQSVKIQEYIEVNKLSFAKDSDLLYLWSKSLANRKGVKISRSKSNLKNYINIDNLWSSFHFSLREFIARMVQKSNYSDADLINLISNGIEELQQFYPNRLQQGSYIYLFFLCHADLETAVNLALFLLDITQKQSSRAIMKKMVQNIGFSQIQMYKIQQFFIENELFFKASASINILPVIASFDIVNSIVLNKNLHFLWRGISLLFFQRKQFILKNLYKVNSITVDLLRNPHIINFANQQKLLQKESLSEEKQIKYIALMKEYKNLQVKNQRLEKDLSQISDRTKTLNDSIFSDQTIYTSNINNDFSKLKEFNEIVVSKNEQIIQLKIKNQSLEQKYTQKETFSQKLLEQNQLLKEKCQQKDKFIEQLQQQKTNLKKMNELLIQKMKQLSKLLMDQQQKQLNCSNQNIEQNKFIDQMRLTYDELNDLSVQNKQKCSIY